MPIIAYPIDDGREVEKHQNGTGIGNAGDPAYTLDTRQHPSVVAFDTYNQSISPISKTLNSDEPVVMPTLTAANNPSRSPQSSEVTAQVEIMERMTSVVRRLTPTECERLQGFPDDWTDGQTDGHRYKQMGNAVTVNVIEWIGSRL